EQALEVGSLEWKELGEFLAALRLRVRQNHLLDVRQPVFRKKHMLGPAQPDSFSAELPSDFGIARNVGIRADSQTADLVGDCHEFGKIAAGGIRIDCGNFAFEHFPRGAFERDPGPFAELLATGGEDLSSLIDW